MALGDNAAGALIMATARDLSPITAEEAAEAVRAVEQYGGQSAAARALGMSRTSLRRRLAKKGEPLRAEAPVPDRAVVVPWVPPKPEAKPRIRVRAFGAPKGNARILVISDLHAPYQHPDALRFLAALKAKYDFDRVVNIGDELDYHAMSFHESDPDLDAAGRELQRGREVLWELEHMFPRMDLVDSNHGSMSYRRAKTGGVPRHLVLDYRDAIFGEKQENRSIIRPNGRGDGWRWQDELLLTLPDGNQCLFVHGRSVSTRRNVEQAGMCFVQGHHHSTFEIVYHGTSDTLLWGMTIGCLIDRSSLAFAYARNSIRRAVIGCGAILDGQPKLLPMVLAKGGRWTGFVP